jgi:hypothetical protein
MALITNVSTPTFDLTAIRQGDAIRVRRAGDTTPRNGIVTRLTANAMTVLYANVQNNQTSFVELAAVDVAVGVWEVWWTTDFVTINYNPGAGSGP